MHQGVLFALLAAASFGASTPVAKMLLGSMPPFTLAALLYLGSGGGLALCLLARRLSRRARVAQAGLTRRDLPWLAGAVLFGGVAGPVFLMYGLARTTGSTASLLLNLEAVLTAALAWCVFGESADRRLVLGMTLIVAGGAVLGWHAGAAQGDTLGAMFIALACLSWAIDNNLTRNVSGSDAMQIATIKGLAAGTVSALLALALGQQLPAFAVALGAGVLGFVGYGLSLVCFVLALRHLGTARTGAYFSTAPFVGAALSLLVLQEAPDALFWVACALMAAGVWLHLSERHAHEHTHEVLTHSHQHRHDEHHQHQHDFEWDGKEPHVHPHHHQAMTHAHAHWPDLHHRHRHQ
ncbi:EamA family transporter [Duganella sp. FT50W]|uniref:EamA family transporter n=1 Tax=Duganella lactea TaxID=2692173 RepID=A0A6L8MKE4_9BURK|nr:DMT family transporter [Duganella lactea]MYM83667.1 EamA family transporter [Duganella lactea]